MSKFFHGYSLHQATQGRSNPWADVYFRGQRSRSSGVKKLIWRCLHVFLLVADQAGVAQAQTAN